jgi:hypothetical protein
MARKRSRHVGTIGEMVNHGHTLTLNCERCRHRSEVDLLALVTAHGPDYLVRRVVDRAVCSACGDRTAPVSCTMGWRGAPAFSYPNPNAAP